VELIEASSEPALVQALAKAIERARPVESRLVRVHDCLWLRMWRAPERAAAGLVRSGPDLFDRRALTIEGLMSWPATGHEKVRRGRKKRPSWIGAGRPIEQQQRSLGMSEIRTLIVDDSSVMRKIVERSLRQAGLDPLVVHEAGSGTEGLEC
jgi:hypothetical protein